MRAGHQIIVHHNRIVAEAGPRGFHIVPDGHGAGHAPVVNGTSADQNLSTAADCDDQFSLVKECPRQIKRFLALPQSLGSRPPRKHQNAEFVRVDFPQ